RGATLYLGPIGEGHRPGFYPHTPRVACRSWLITCCNQAWHNDFLTLRIQSYPKAIYGDRVAGNDGEIAAVPCAQGATLYLGPIGEGHRPGFHPHTPRVTCRSWRTRSSNLTRDPEAPVHHEGVGGHRHIPTPTSALGDAREKRALTDRHGLGFYAYTARVAR